MSCVLYTLFSCWGWPRKYLQRLHKWRMMATAFAVSFAICKAANSLTKSFGIRGGELPIVTAIVVILATLLPSCFRYLAPAGDAFALVLMQIFFAVLGASGSVWNVINTAPSIFFFDLVQVSIHLVVILGLGKLFQIDRKLIHFPY